MPHKRDPEGRVKSNDFDSQQPFDPSEKRLKISEVEHKRVSTEKEGTTHATSGINFDLYENIPVTVHGKNLPKPAETFDDLQLTPFLKVKIANAQYKNPTPVQKNAIPIIFGGHDLMASAQTGSGKTAAFLFPFINTLFQSDVINIRQRMSNTCTPNVLIMVPTRELAVQIHSESSKFTSGSPIKACVVYGGASMTFQMRQLERGCHILIATPGRLKDLMDRKRVSLSQIKNLCLDEADRMLDMGFEPQIREIVENSDMPGKDVRQTVLFSATFPRQIQQLARDFLRSEYAFLEVGRVGSTTELIKQVIKEVYDKNSEIIKDLKEIEGRTLVFVQKKVTAEHLSRFLRQQGFLSTEIHGDRAQRERELALRLFKQGNCPILVATSVASRGLDIDGVKHVINYDFPSEFDDYIHRIGRTGRAGKQGVATSYFTSEDEKMADELVQCLTENKQEVPEFLYFLSRAPKRRSNGFRGRRNGYGGGNRNRGNGGGGGFRRNGGGDGGFGNGGNSNGYSNGNSNGYSNGNSNGYNNGGGYGNDAGHSNGYGNSHSSSGGFGNGYRNSNSSSNGDGFGNGFGNNNSNGYSNGGGFGGNNRGPSAKKW